MFLRLVLTTISIGLYWLLLIIFNSASLITFILEINERFHYNCRFDLILWRCPWRRRNVNREGEVRASLTPAFSNPACSVLGMTLNCIHIFIVTGSCLYWCVMRPASQRFFIHTCFYLPILIISYLATFLGTNSVSVPMCRKAVNQSNQADMLDDERTNGTIFWLCFS